MPDFTSLLQQFASMGQALVGRGPDHPTAPNPAARHEVEAFLRQFPALEYAPDYLGFLRQYGGAFLEVPNAASLRWSVWLPGFWEAGEGLCAWNEEGYGPDTEGFLLFAQMFHQVTRTEIEFGFFIRGRHEHGVYRTLYTAEDWKGLPPTLESVELLRKRLGRKWYCASFHEWFTRLVEKGEVLFDES